LPRPGRYLSILTGTSQVILSAQKTGENGGVIARNPGYTYYCAEEPTSKAPTISIVLIVEPGTVLVAQVKSASMAACEAEYLEALHLDMTSDMPWKDQAGRNHKKIPPVR